MRDKIVAAAQEDLAARSALGLKKYGVTLDEHPANLRYWLQNAYEEALDQALYLRRAIMELDEAPK